MAGYYEAGGRIEYRGGSSSNMPPPWETWRTLTVWGVLLGGFALLVYNDIQARKEREAAKRASGG